MIKEFVEQWNNRKHEIREVFSRRHPRSYEDLLRETLKILDGPNPNIIHTLDANGVEGILIFIIQKKGWPPYDFFYIKIYYDPVDCLELIRGDDCYSTPSQHQTNEYMIMCLKIILTIEEMHIMDEAEYRYRSEIVKKEYVEQNEIMIMEQDNGK